MTYKSILVPIDGSPEAERRTRVAAQLAAAFDAQLTGIAIVPPLDLPQRLRSHPGAKAVLKDEFQKELALAQQQAHAFPVSARLAGATRVESRVAEAEPVDALLTAAGSVDLLVLGQPGADDIGVLGAHFIERMVAECQRPILLVPRQGNASPLGGTVLVAWKSAVASARAVEGAEPFLARARVIALLAVSEDDDGARGDEGAAYLERHGHSVRPLVERAEDAGAAILAQARKQQAALIVMGAFARSRMSEMILGGATRTVLRDMVSCVLMSH